MDSELIIAEATRRLLDDGDESGFTLEQEEAIRNAIYALKQRSISVEVLQSDMNDIRDYLENACVFIEGNKNLNEIINNGLLAALGLAKRYSSGITVSAAQKTEENNDSLSLVPITFKVDNVPVRVGQDIRVEYTDPVNGNYLIVVLTHEGIIMDCWTKTSTEVAETSSITFDEQIEEMLKE